MKKDRNTAVSRARRGKGNKAYVLWSCQEEKEKGSGSWYSRQQPIAEDAEEKNDKKRINSTNESEQE